VANGIRAGGDGDSTVILGIYNVSTPVGIRAVERFYLRKSFQIKALARDISDIAGISRFAADVILLSDSRQLSDSLSNCDILLYCSKMNTPANDTIALFREAQRAGVRRFVKISMMFNERPEVISDLQPSQNEGLLLSELKAGKTELTILRPGNLHGPRCFWSLNSVNQLITKEPRLPHNGHGAFNGTYIDNLLQAVEQACSADSSAVNGKIFWVTDGLNTTWKDYFSVLADAIAHVTGTHGESDIEAVASSTSNGTQAVKRLQQELLRISLALPLPYGVRHRAKSRLESLSETGWISHAQGYLDNISINNIRDVLGYEPAVDLHSACLATAGWLDFAQKLAAWKNAS
jgi:nucleoside-diphosphate-sugar epimerase